MGLNKLRRDLGERDAPRVDASLQRNRRRVNSGLAGYFSAPEVRRVLDRGGEVVLFTHNSSSMGAAMSAGSRPDYEVVVDKTGLSIRRRGSVSPGEHIDHPLTSDSFATILPYGGHFHDSSSGDYEFRPEPANYLRMVEGLIRGL